MKKIILLTGLLSILATAQERAPTGGRPRSEGQGARVTTATRAVSKYMAEERKLLEAVQAKEESAVDKILADDFEVWSGDKDSPTPRAEWSAGRLGESAKAFRIRDMAVREFGDTALVSFLLERSQPTLRTDFIVDVWRQSEDKLAVRYECTPGKAAKPKHAPTGKE